MDPQGTQLARKVMRECHWCRRENLKMQKQLMAALPEYWLAAGKPFHRGAENLKPSDIIRF